MPKPTEKEERILIGTDIERPCFKCKEEVCPKRCEVYEKFENEFVPSALKVLYRQEAIEKMAKAMCKKDFGDCGKCMCRNNDECYTVVEDSKWFGLAEAALNALLED